MKIGGYISLFSSKYNARYLPLILKDERAFFSASPFRDGQIAEKYLTEI